MICSCASQFISIRARDSQRERAIRFVLQFLYYFTRQLHIESFKFQYKCFICLSVQCSTLCVYVVVVFCVLLFYMLPVLLLFRFVSLYTPRFSRNSQEHYVNNKHKTKKMSLSVSVYMLE